MRDLKSNFKATTMLAPALRTSHTSAAIDTLGFDSLALLVTIGACTNGGFTFKLTECDTVGGSYTDVAAVDQVGTLPAVTLDESPNAYSRAGSTIGVSYVGNKRFVKVDNTVTGSPGAGIIAGVIAIQGHAHQKPVVQA